jgi:hypothetical protein
MSRHTEDQLREAFAARAGAVTEATLRPAEPPSDDASWRGDIIDLPHPRRPWVAPLLAAAAVAALAVGTSIVVGATRGHHAQPGAPSTGSGSTTAPAPTTAPVPSRPAPTGPAPTQVVPPVLPSASTPSQSTTTSPGYVFGYQPLWPFPDLATAQAWQAAHRSGGHQPWHLDAGQTALSFTRGYLGFTDITAVTSSRITAEGTYVGVGYRDPNGAAHTSAVLFLARFGPDADSPWEVVGSEDSTFSLEQPAYGSQVMSPMSVGGHISGVDENIRITVRSLASTAPVGGFCCLPAGGDRSPWSATVPFSAGSGQVLTIVASTGGHLQAVERFALMGVHS